MTTPIPSPGHAPGAAAAGPRYFQAITIAYAIVAGLAILGGLGAIVGLFFARNIVGSLPTAPPGSSAHFERMQVLQEQIAEAQMPWVQGSFGLLEAAVAGAALYTVIRIMQRRPAAVRPFQHAALAFVCVAVGRSVIDGVVQIRVMSLMRGFIDDFMSGAPGHAPPGIDGLMENAMLGGAIMGMVWSVLWLAAKMALILYARHYVTTPLVRAHLGAPADPTASPLSP